MNIYEDKYLREKVNRIIARQKEGKVVIASYKDGSGLPAREDLGPELTRAAPHTIMRSVKPVISSTTRNSAHTCLLQNRVRNCPRRWPTTDL